MSLLTSTNVTQDVSICRDFFFHYLNLLEFLAFLIFCGFFYATYDHVCFIAVKKEIQRMSDAFKDLGSAFKMDPSPGIMPSLYKIYFSKEYSWNCYFTFVHLSLQILISVCNVCQSYKIPIVFWKIKS